MRYALFLCLAFLSGSAPLFAQTPSDAVAALLDAVWQYDLAEQPLLATDVGDSRGQDRLANMSLAAIERRHERERAFLKQAKAIDREALSRRERVDLEIVQRQLENRIEDFAFQTHLIPITNREGFHLSFPELPRLMQPQEEADIANYIARLRDFERYANEHIALLRRGIEVGRTLPAVVLRDVSSQIEPHVVDDPEDSLLYAPFKADRPKTIDAARWDELRQGARDAIGDHVVPAYREFLRFMQDEYVPACRDSIGASALPNGRAFYRSRIEQFTTLPLSAESIHQTGLEEVERIRKEMESVRKEVGFEGTLAEFIEHLRTDPQFYAESPEELLQRAALILKRLDGQLPRLFGKLPRIPYGLREVPDYVAPQTTSAYYWPPATDGTRGGFYYLNTYDLSSRPLYQLEALSMHEAVPGHHLQLALQAEMDDLHPFRRKVMFTAFIEGWALYSEGLGESMGFYNDPYQRFGRLSMEAWRACRLVVDTGIHRFGWTRQQAIEYMSDNTALSKHNVVAEVDRYIAWPGQALAYKTGELAILSLRRDAESKLGTRFDVRAFHDTLLEQGAVPLPLLQAHVRDWIASQESEQ